jgi:hypothetical protein
MWSGAVVSNTTPTVIIASSALLREGVTSLLQGTRFKVVSAVAIRLNWQITS